MGLQPDQDALRTQLNPLQRVLEKHREHSFAHMVYDAIQGTDEELALFLMSNELWGGAGSIADQTGLE